MKGIRRVRKGQGREERGREGCKGEGRRKG